jgi:hypothetical protein
VSTTNRILEEESRVLKEEIVAAKAQLEADQISEVGRID